jgi:hypothetical protein
VAIKRRLNNNSMTQQSTVEERWEREFDSMFNWAEQVREKELGHWKMMYGFTPKDLKQFIKSELQLAEQKARELERNRIKFKINELWNNTRNPSNTPFDLFTVITSIDI